MTTKPKSCAVRSAPTCSLRSAPPSGPPLFASCLQALGFDADAALTLARGLVARRVRHVAATPLWCLCVEAGGAVTLRPKADVIGELLAAGLSDPVRLLLAAKPRPGELMAWVSGAEDCAIYKLALPSGTGGRR